MATPQPSTALAKRNSETALMPPPPLPKRIKRPTQVLDEDVYTDALSHIIARDFFPGLLETQAQQEYLEALDSQNNEWIRDAGRRLHQAMTPGPGGRGRRGTSLAQTPRQSQTRLTSNTPRGWAGETPRGRTAVSETPTSVSGVEPRQPKVDASLSISAFQAKYTSEDNESFYKLLDKQNVKRAEKYAFLHDVPVARRNLEWRNQQQQQKMLAPPPATSQDGSQPSSSTAMVLRPSQDLDDRPVQIESFKPRQGARNSLMYQPDSVEDTHTTVAQAAADRSLAPPKSVSYAATRLPTTNVDDIPAPSSPPLSAIDAAIAGRPRPSSTDAGASDYGGGGETPRVAGYTFVDEDDADDFSASGVPISEEEADRQEREAAMALMPKLDSSSSPGKGGFNLQSASKREELHHRIVDKQNLARRKPSAHLSNSATTNAKDRLAALRAGNATALTSASGRTPTPKFTTCPVVNGGSKRHVPGGNLTPAARMLAASLGGSSSSATPGPHASSSPSLFGDTFSSGEKQKQKSRAWTPITPGVKRR